MDLKAGLNISDTIGAVKRFRQSFCEKTAYCGKYSSPWSFEKVFHVNPLAFFASSAIINTNRRSDFRTYFTASREEIEWIVLEIPRG